MPMPSYVISLIEIHTVYSFRKKTTEAKFSATHFSGINEKNISCPLSPLPYFALPIPPCRTCNITSPAKTVLTGTVIAVIVY
jgi:hypothetical protein